jgi:hypothetical protein
MAWLSESEISLHLSKYDFDIRKSNNARWIDQKCTPDVLCIVADCIVNYIDDNNISTPFTSIDIWHCDYAMKNVEQIFSKPGLELNTVENEYNKFFQQPMELLVYARVLNKNKIGNKNIYSLNEINLLRYISIRERNSLIFLQLYIEKVLHDSDILAFFNHFFAAQSQENYLQLKEEFVNFTIYHTPIKKETECRRIFTKIINPLAFKYKSCGTEHGRMSVHPITFDMLMYNRDNFRDLYTDKPKNFSRQQHLEKIKSRPNWNYFLYTSQKAKKQLREYNNHYRHGRSEVDDGLETSGLAINIHHIFPEAQYPEIASYLENLIALTPNQHYISAHTNGNTQIVNKDYQHKCLVAKIDMIRKNLELDSQHIIYEFEKFIHVLNVGLETDEFSSIDYLDFSSLANKLSLFYNKTR